MLRGIEQYQGKTIFHGLASFVDPPSEPVKRPDWMIQQKNKIFKESFGLELSESQSWPDVFNSNLTIIAKCIIDASKISRVSFLPCLINKLGQPEILKHDVRGQQVFNYMDEITRAAGLNAQYEWAGDEVAVNF
jgi:poly-gamma-glutamate synthesis protein (capsule biosynthesis protein)